VTRPSGALPGASRPGAKRPFRGLLLAAALALPGTALAGACPTLPQPPIVSARLADALRQPGGARIVALGSSSTAGSGATDADHAYPAVLEARLRATIGAPVTVLNRGRGGEDAGNMLARIARDAVAEHPDLVIWQVGANAAMRRMDPAAFEGFVRDGVQRLRDAGIEVVLMDNQRAPRIAASPDHGRFDAILARIAATTPGVMLFSRGALMDGWAAAGIPSEALLTADGLHHNDRGYACIAEALAGALTTRLPPILAVRGQ
jgi:acyl-CoA thioesterase-1